MYSETFSDLRGTRRLVNSGPPAGNAIYAKQASHEYPQMLIGIAREKGVSAYVGDGLNRWPEVHRLDAAPLYRLVLEKGSAGARYHGTADQGVPFREIAEVIGKRRKVPVVAKSAEQAAEHFGFLGHFVGRDCLASSAQTQKQLEWRPKQPGLIADLDSAHYFETAQAASLHR